MLQLTPEQENDLLMQRSVMDEPRSMLQKVLDFAWGRTLPEQATSAFTGGLSGIIDNSGLKLAKTAPDWFKRVWEGGRGEIPTGPIPRRLSVSPEAGLVKNPVTYELPEAADELAPLLEQLGGSYGKRKLPPVSGGAPSMFEKFTSKGLPVPQGMWNPEYKSTQDLIGNWAHREALKPNEFGPRTVRKTDTDEFIQRFAEKRMHSIRGAVENNPVNPIEAVRELGKAFGANDAETAALVRRYHIVTPGNREDVPLSRLLTPQRYNDLMNWVKSQLGH